MRYFGYHASMEELRVVEYSLHGVDRTAWNRCRHEQIHPLAALFRFKHFMDERQQDLSVFNSLRISLKSRIFNPFIFSDQLAEIYPEFLIGDGYRDRNVGGVENLVWDDGFVGRPPMLGFLSRDKVRRADICE